MATNQAGPMTPGTHADLVARLEELASKNGCFSAVYENCIEQGAPQADMCLTCAAATAAKALAALPPPADPPAAPQAGDEHAPLCDDCGEPLVCPAGTAERIAGLELMHEQTLTRAEQAEAAIRSRPADLPALVALVREWQEAYQACSEQWGARWVTGRASIPQTDEERAVVLRADAAVAALLAYPLPAPDRSDR